MKNPSEIIPTVECADCFEETAYRDALTGLPNRGMLNAHLNKAIAQSKRRKQPLAVVCVELSGVKEINARHGHMAGNLLLATVAGGMKRILRKGDALARVSGCEFAAVLQDLSSAEAGAPALGRLMEAATTPIEYGNSILQASAVAGVSFYPQAEETDGEQLLFQARQAMRQARAKGKNSYLIFDGEQSSEADDYRESVGRIRRAWKARELVVFFHPIVNMCSGKVVGAEALIRWQHPERGLLLPIEFLSEIEGHPLSTQIGEWVIGEALTQLERWQEQGLELSISVNVDVRQLQNPGFVERLAALLAEHPRIRPSRLELDILESSALEDVAQLSMLLVKCREMGVTFALDDFGTGHSSLNDLKRLPVNVLKIDPSFVHDILDNPDDLTILEGVLGLATAFRRQSVAEGVENVEQGVMLLRLGCELAQGYAIAPPMRAEEFPAWAASWRPDPRWREALSVSVDDRPLLHAGVEHRAWAAAIEAFLKGESAQEPRLSRHQCGFGAWIDSDGPAGRSSQMAFQAVVALHWKIHALAAGIVKFHAEGRKAEALARFSELNGLVDKLVELLNDLARNEQAGEVGSKSAQLRT